MKKEKLVKIPENINIGTDVKWQHEVHVRKLYSTTPVKRIVEKRDLQTPKFGKVVGAKLLQEGSIEYIDDLSVFQPSKILFVILVRQGWLNKPAMVFPEDLEVVSDEEKPKKFPIQKQDHVWTDYARTAMRRLINEYMIRDSKGRFVRLK